MLIKANLVKNIAERPFSIVLLVELTCTSGSDQCNSSAGKLHIYLSPSSLSDRTRDNARESATSIFHENFATRLANADAIGYQPITT